MLAPLGSTSLWSWNLTEEHSWRITWKSPPLCGQDFEPCPCSFILPGRRSGQWHMLQWFLGCGWWFSGGSRTWNKQGQNISDKEVWGWGKWVDLSEWAQGLNVFVPVQVGWPKVSADQRTTVGGKAFNDQVPIQHECPTCQQRRLKLKSWYGSISRETVTEKVAIYPLGNASAGLPTWGFSKCFICHDDIPGTSLLTRNSLRKKHNDGLVECIGLIHYVLHHWKGADLL